MSQQVDGVEPASAPLRRAYATAALLVGAVGAWLCWLLLGGTSAPSPAVALVSPMLAQFWLTALVWLVMLVARNTAVLRGTASLRYFAAYQVDLPAEHVERPARTFDNLMQVPTLFYVVCLLMLVTQHADAKQVALAWAFVALRALHAALYITLNRLPLRFASWVSSCLALGLLWYRFGAMV